MELETKKEGFFKRWGYLFFFPLSIIWCEIAFRIFIGNFFDIGLLFSVLLVIPLGIVFTVISSFFKNIKVNKGIAIALSSLIFLIFSIQTVYYNVFNKLLVIYSLTAGGAELIATEGDFLATTFVNILYCLPIILILFVPTLFLIIFGNKLFCFNKASWLNKGISLISAVLIRALIIFLIISIPFCNEIYNGIFNQSQMLDKFGLLTTEYLDIKNNLLNLGNSGELVIETNTPTNSSNVDNEEIQKPTSKPQTLADSKNEISSNASSEIKKPTVYKKNIMNIDFDELIAKETDKTVISLHKYFKGEKATLQNEYTGMFEDYNLIMLTAEGFAPYAIDKKLTPTLYKMYNEGFKFTNYYNPPWSVSTSDGEYVECTGLIPKSGVWSFHETGKNNIFLPFTMPQQFLNIGINPVYGYHNNTYSYYHRDISHPNLGYLYKGQGNGLNIKKTWPQSDNEMIQLTTDDYLNSGKRFHAYYMTVSGHMRYDFENNYMSYKYKDYVKDLPYSDTVKAYIACNMDLDRAMKTLLTRLEEKGIADKTLIVISPDHTPYGLEKTGPDKYEYFNEIFGHKVETQFEVNQSVLLIYSPSMKKSVTINKVCSPLDIIPTLNNLLGFEYDSRLLPGKDIFSTEEGLVIFENKSFITDSGRYFSKTGEFVLNKGKTVNKDYVKQLRQAINNKFVVSKQIIETNYYKKTLLNRTHIKGGLTK